MTERATLWGPNTWYPPTDSMNQEISKKEIEVYAARQLPPGVKLTGQMEQCPDTGRYHYQFMAKTPQMRFAAVKKMLTFMEQSPHIEKARSSEAVTKYVQKEDTRVSTVQSAAPIPSLFEYQDIVASKWRQDEYNKRWQTAIEQTQLPHPDDVAMSYLDDIVAADIESGRRGAEYIAINPMWRSSWKKFWRSIIKRHASSQSSEAPPPPDESETCTPGDASGE